MRWGSGAISTAVLSSGDQRIQWVFFGEIRFVYRIHLAADFGGGKVTPFYLFAVFRQRVFRHQRDAEGEDDRIFFFIEQRGAIRFTEQLRWRGDDKIK